MAETKFKHLTCPVVVLTIDEAQVMGDALADELRDEFLTVFDQTGAVDVVVDFRKVSYISSAGLRPLLNLVRRTRERGGRLVLCNLSPDVESVFEATRLVRSTGSAPATFEREKDVPAAVASLFRAPGAS